MLNNAYIKESATKEGFDLVGITFPREFEVNRTALEGWIAKGAADSLAYMKEYMDIRFNPANLHENTQSIVVCAVNYKSRFSLAQKQENHPKIASYALARDYHKVIRKQLKALLRRLQTTHPALRGRCCVDTAPLLEKQLAVEAGLGWIGRQSLLVTPQYGSFVVLGVLLLDDEVDHFDTPYKGVECGKCNRCVEQCPNGAILDDRMIDSRKCISALTVECDSTNGEDLNGWVFGCDECQSCCSYNQRSPLSTNAEMQPIFAPLSLDEWHSMSADEFTAKLHTTPLKRAGLERMKRNSGSTNSQK